MNYHVLKHLSKAQIVWLPSSRRRQPCSRPIPFLALYFIPTGRHRRRAASTLPYPPVKLRRLCYRRVAGIDTGYPYTARRFAAKKAAAFPGDTYEMTASRLAVNGRVYPVYHLPYLPTQPAGSYAVPEGTILFLNDPVISLDSRYFGPIPQANIKKESRVARQLRCNPFIFLGSDVMKRKLAVLLSATLIITLSAGLVSADARRILRPGDHVIDVKRLADSVKETAQRPRNIRTNWISTRIC